MGHSPYPKLYIGTTSHIVYYKQLKDIIYNNNNMEKNKCLVPISLGELYDKYTILQIKRNKITNEYKLSNVIKELEYLKYYVDKFNLDLEIIKELEEINKKLWIIEENIREKETKNEFDEEFITYARNIYKINDMRSNLKNKINILINSDLIDIKNYSNI